MHKLGLKDLSPEEVLLVSGGTQKTDGYPDTWGEMTWGERACFAFWDLVISDDPYRTGYEVEADVFCGTNMTGENPNAPGTGNGY